MKFQRYSVPTGSARGIANSDCGINDALTANAKLNAENVPTIERCCWDASARLRKKAFGCMLAGSRNTRKQVRCKKPAWAEVDHHAEIQKFNG
jgi:hypothetical protein